MPQLDDSSANLTDAIRMHAERAPRAPAIIRGDQALTYADLDAAISRVAAALAMQGLRAGDMVGIAMGNNPLHLIVMLALARMGAVSIPIHVLAPAEQRRTLVDHYEVKALVARRPDAAVGGVPLIRPEPTWLQGPAEGGPRSAPGGQRGWRLRLTSGTTGVPKGVLYTHADTLAFQRLLQTVLGSGPATRHLVAIDINTGACVNYILCHLLHGGSVVFPRSLRDTAEVLAAIVEHRVTHAYVSPEILRRWLEVRATDARPFPGLARLSVGGAALSESLRKDAMQRITPNLYVGCGATETALIAVADPETVDRHPGCAGRVVPWVEAQAADEAHQPLPAGETGALRFRGTGIAKSYYRNPEASARAFRDGWAYTGDTGRITADRVLYFGGRLDDLVNLGGTKVDPLHVEEILLAHPDVAEAAAFGVTNPAGRTVLMAAVVTRQPVAEQQLLSYARARLGVLAPRRILAMRALPRNAMGKVLRQELASSIVYRLPRSSRPSS